MLGGLALALIAATTLSVEPTPEAAGLRAMLVAELGATAVVEDGGTFRVGLRTRDAALELEIREARGELVVARRFELSAGRPAAMRSALLAIARAVEAAEAAGAGAQSVAPPRPAPPVAADASAGSATADATRASPTPGSDPAAERAAPPPAPGATAERTSPPGPGAAASDPIVSPPPGPGAPPSDAPAPRSELDPSATDAPPLWIRLGAGVAGPPASPQLDAELAARLVLTDRLDVGLGAGVQGLLCCALDEPLTSGGAGLTGDLTRVRALASASVRLFSLGALDLSAQAGVGMLWQSLSTTPSAFAGGQPVHVVEAWSALGRASAILGGPLAGDRWRWRLEAGADLHGALTAELPPAFPARGDPIDTGFLSPFARLMVELRAL